MSSSLNDISERQLEQKQTRLRSALRQLSAAEQPDAPARLALAEVHFRLAVLPVTSTTAAIEHLQQAITYDSLHPKLFFHLGRVLYRYGDYLGACHQFRRAIQLAPASHRSYAHLALTLMELGKVEKDIGNDILMALSDGEEQELERLVTELDDYLKAKAAIDKDKEPPSRDKGKSKKKGITGETPSSSRWQGVWRLMLMDYLCTAKSIKSRQIEKLLAFGQPHVTDYAIVGLLRLLAGESSKAVDRMAENADLQDQAAHPSASLLQAAISLAAIKEDVEEFVAQSISFLAEQAIPLEVVCCFHYVYYGPDSDLPVTAVLQYLDHYPPHIQKQAAFQDLRLAILDGLARRAWNDKAFLQARLLWQETIPLDSSRISVAHNLALLAAKTKAYEAYPAAWTRAVELRYLQAAAMGDIEFLLEERRTLHKACVQQSRQRHCAPPKQPDGAPKDEELASWLQDQGALQTWLNEWDLYYLNSRLRFRSPVHLLGIPRDAAPEATAEARDALLRQIEISLKSQPWIGIASFCDLAAARVTQAFEDASDPIKRARDRYYENEKDEANELIGETISRGFLLHRMITMLGEGEFPQAGQIGCSVARHLFALPWKILQPVCAARGLIEEDLDLVKVFENFFLRLLAGTPTNRQTEQAINAQLAVITEGIAILPHSIELHFTKSQLLLTAKRQSEAYAAATDALALLADEEDGETGQNLRENLKALIDNIALSTLSEQELKPSSREEAKETIKKGSVALEEYPLAAGLRIFVANLMLQLGGGERIKTAVSLLKKGLELAVDTDQEQEIKNLLSQADKDAKMAPVVEEIKSLLENAARRVNDAVNEINQKQSLEAYQAAKPVIDQAIKDVEKARKQAEDANLPNYVQEAQAMAQQFKGVQAKLQEV